MLETSRRIGPGENSGIAAAAAAPASKISQAGSAQQESAGTSKAGRRRVLVQVEGREQHDRGRLRTLAAANTAGWALDR